jgi:hypothetical protein
MSHPLPQTRRAQPKPGAERRVAVRHSFPIAACWRRLGAGPEDFAPGSIQDISRAGFSLVVDQPFKRGDILIVRLAETAGDGVELWLVRVKHAREQPGQRWQLGCSFTRAITEQDLQELLRPRKKAAQPAANEPRSDAAGARSAADPFVEGSASERRGAARRSGAVVPVLLYRANTGETPLRGWVIDRSAGGLSLSVPRAFTAGSLLKVRLDRGRQDTPWVQVRVKSCRAKGKLWHLGCQFTESLPSHLLMLFG